MFLNDPESGDFWKRRASRCMWTDENGRFLSKIMLVGSRRRYTWKLRSEVQPLTIQCAKITSTCMIITIFQDDYHLKFNISDLFCEKTTPNCAQKFGFCPFLCFLFKFSKKILCLWLTCSLRNKRFFVLISKNSDEFPKFTTFNITKNEWTRFRSSQLTRGE